MARYKVTPKDGVNLRRTPEALADLSNREDTLLFGTEFDAAPVKAIAATARAAPTNFFLLRMRVTPLVLNSRPGSEK